MPVDILDRDGIVLHTVEDSDDLIGVDLSNLSLFRADLSNQDLTGSNLFGTDLRRSRCVNTIFDNCNIEDIVFTRANLNGARLNDVVAPFSTFKLASMAGSVFRRANFTGVNFVGADLTGAIGVDAVLVQSRFRSITDGDISDTILVDVNFRGANLLEANFSGIDMSNANLRGANCKRAKFNRCNLTGTNFTAAEVTEAAFNNAIITPTTNFNNSIAINSIADTNETLASDLIRFHDAMDKASDLDKFPEVWQNFFMSRIIHFPD